MNMQALIERTLLVSGFKEGVDKHQLADHFMRYGGVLEVTLKENGTSAVIEFHDGRCIPPLLSQSHFIGEDKLAVSPCCPEVKSPKKKRSRKAITHVENLQSSESEPKCGSSDSIISETELAVKKPKLHGHKSSKSTRKRLKRLSKKKKHKKSKKSRSHKNSLDSHSTTETNETEEMS